ncbi:MAG: hypothetical protein HKN25_17590, partial [Pyrinomonadaceae bacterium]|nr:hypothetical protein [Pyrinomonadaceae bacterium]
MSVAFVKTLLFLFGAISLSSLSVSALTVDNKTFWLSLLTHCGKAYAGEIIHAPENDSFRGKKLVMHVRSCEEDRIRIPFFVGEDRSRTWVLTNLGERIRLKHDHRHKDGTPDDVTMYGGISSNSGSTTRQVFPADEETAKLIPAAASNVWWVDLTKKSFTYNLRRVGTDRHFSIKFDLTKEVAKPEAPWGWNKVFPLKITYEEGQDRYPSFSATGKKILFESNRNGHWGIYEMNSDGTDSKLISDKDSKSRYPSYAISGAFIIYAKKLDGAYRVTFMTRDGSEFKMPGRTGMIGAGLGDALFPVVAPKRPLLAFSARSDLYVQNPGGRRPFQRIASTEFREAWLRWSPDGKKVAFFSRRDTNDQDDEIYIMDYPDGKPKRITHRKGHDFCPSWSPDGKRLAVAAVDEKLGRSINIIDLNGKILSRLGLGFERVTEPNWSPDGKQIIYTARKEGNYDIYTED